jgi:ribosomal protein S18 acetylase RimI-like enzyme
VRVRSALESDAEALAQAEYATASNEEGLLLAKPGEIPVDSFRSKIRELGPNGLYLVMESEGRAVAHLILEPLALESIRHVAQLTIVVHPGHTEKGYGRALMKHAIERAQRFEIEKIELRVRSTNLRAIALYESLGFRREGTLNRHVKLRRGYADDVCMGLFIRGDAV